VGELNPALEIRVCGQFALFRYGSQEDIEAIAGSKPMELLKFMIASSGRPTPITYIYRTLWQEADDAHAKAAFDGTLWRLRRQLDVEAALPLKGGFLSLNSTVVALDLWKFDELAQSIDDLARNPGVDAVEYGAVLATNLMETIQGPCFWLEPEYAWVYGLQTKFRQKYLKTVLTLGRWLEACQQIEDAVKLYTQALEYYPDSDEICLNLVNCRIQQGLHAEAMMTFRCFQHILRDTLGAEPSPSLRHAITDLLGCEKAL
jgi:two-component SAPR family response regulator